MNIIPQPQTYVPLDGQLIIDKDSKVYCQDDLKSCGEALIDNIQSHSGIRLAMTDSVDNATIHLIISDSVPSNEYSIDCSVDTVTITVANINSCRLAVVSLLQLFELDDKDNSKIICPNCHILDYPKYQHRGLHLDIARHYLGIDSILQVLESMYHVKLNYLHLHLSDDQAFRVQIDKYPLLWQVASKREGSVVRHNGKTYNDNTPHQGYLSKADVKLLVDTASQYGIEIIPEIDIPGHTTAILSVYPQLSCVGQGIEIRQDYGIFKDILCAGNDQVYDFVKDILDEIMEMFPCKYIHLGGDEAPKDRWCNCKKCIDKKRQLNLASFEQLQSYMTNQFADYLASKGRVAICWNDGISTLSNQGIVCQQWKFGTVRKGATMINNGRKAIMSNYFHMYFDLPYALIPLKKTYRYRPAKHVSSKNQGNILGVEGCLWTEYVTDISKLQFNLYPRMLALAEVAWGTNNNYRDFVKRAKQYYKVYRAKDVNFNSKAINDDNVFKRMSIVNKFVSSDANIELNT